MTHILKEKQQSLVAFFLCRYYGARKSHPLTLSANIQISFCDIYVLLAHLLTIFKRFKKVSPAYLGSLAYVVAERIHTKFFIVSDQTSQACL